VVINIVPGWSNRLVYRGNCKCGPTSGTRICLFELAWGALFS